MKVEYLFKIGVRLSLNSRYIFNLERIVKGKFEGVSLSQLGRSCLN